MNPVFRKRSFDDVVKILRRRGLLIALPALSGFVAVLLVLPGLPNVYRSTTFLTLTPPTISEKVAPSLTDDNLSQRLQSISSTVLSRSALEDTIERLGLYQEERNARVPMEQIVERMKDSIEVVPEKADNNQTVGFRISYRYREAKTTQLVTADLANQYIAAQNRESKESAETTREFIDAQLAQAKSQLDSIEQERLGVMVRNVEALPESAQGLIAQMSGLRSREQTISKEREALMTERGRALESIRTLNAQMRLVENFGEKETQDAVNQAARIEDTPAYAELIKKRAESNAKLENLRKQYRERHPEVVQAQIEINKINEEIDKLARTTEQRIRRANESVSRKADMQKQSMEIERQKSESQIAQIDEQLRMKDVEMRQNMAQIAAIESKINTIPNVKVALEGINNQYSSAKNNYDEILKKYNTAQQQVEREANEQGETIAVVDPANLPETAENAKKKPMFLGLGAGGGLFLGLLLTAFFEVPRLFRIQDIVDTEYYTGLPVLAAVPPLLTEKEIVSNRRMDKLKILGGIILAVAAVPALAFVFSVTGIFERLS